MRENADPYGTLTDDAITAALTRTRLWPLIESRGGLDAIMTAQPLSQGEQQLFGLARAILRKSSILVLDEATSSVDTETERFMLGLLREEFGGCTVLSVAHRMEAIMDSDRVLVLDEGRVVEFGGVEELLVKGGVFAGLCAESL